MKVLLMGQEETYLGNVLVIQVSAFKDRVDIHSSKITSKKKIPTKAGVYRPHFAPWPFHAQPDSLNHTS